MNITINKNSKTPVYVQIAQGLKTIIIKGELMDGFYLPSEREMAKLAGVHRNTVTRAYNELKADGLVTSVKGSGYIVAFKDDSVNGCRDDLLQIAIPQEVNWAELIKDDYPDMEKTTEDLFPGSIRPGMISFADGMASPEIYKDKDIIENISQIILEGRKCPCFHTPYRGDEGLRRELAAFMRHKGILVKPGEIQVLSATNQALDFLATLLLKPGGKVILEEPVSPDIYRPVELAGGKVVTVPIDSNGMICDRLEPLIETHRPDFIFVNSSSHDPAGVVLSLERRNKLLELSYRYGLPIIENDGAPELNFDSVRLPSIKALDKGNNVIYLYSFALTFMPGIHMAFVAAPGSVIKSMSRLASMRMARPDWIPQKFLARCMANGLYQKRLFEFSKDYRSKRDLMCSWLDKAVPLGLSYNKPGGGVYVWCKLPDSVDIKELAHDAEKQGVCFAPGNIFYPGKEKGGNFIRLNYSYPSKVQIDEGMGVLVKLIEDAVR